MRAMLAWLRPLALILALLTAEWLYRRKLDIV